MCKELTLLSKTLVKHPRCQLTVFPFKESKLVFHKLTNNSAHISHELAKYGSSHAYLQIPLMIFMLSIVVPYIMSFVSFHYYLRKTLPYVFQSLLYVRHILIFSSLSEHAELFYHYINILFQIQMRSTNDGIASKDELYNDSLYYYHLIVYM